MPTPETTRIVRCADCGSSRVTIQDVRAPEPYIPSRETWQVVFRRGDEPKITIYARATDRREAVYRALELAQLAEYNTAGWIVDPQQTYHERTADLYPRSEGVA